MYHAFIPTPLHHQADKLIADLTAFTHAPTACPYCRQNTIVPKNAERGYYYCKSCHKNFNRTVGTPFYRLTPLEWLPIIAKRRLCGQRYAQIRYALNYCEANVVKRRVIAIEHYMASNYPALFDWYQGFITEGKNNLPTAVKQEAEQLKSWVKQRLQDDNLTCPHCQSDKIKKSDTTRARLRCQTCWRYFSSLTGSGLEQMRFSQHWLTMIDMLVEKQTNQAIAKTLKLNHSTVTRARRNWLWIMQQRGFLVVWGWVS